MQPITFIDLFSGMGGLRLGFQQAIKAAGETSKCVLSSEIKPAAVQALKHNFPNDGDIHAGDITLLPDNGIPDFDYLLAGFPCQPFSNAGKRKGFGDIRGTLFFHVARLIKLKNPTGFLLENVEGLIKHDLAHPKDPIGRTLLTILHTLEELGYKVSYHVINAADHGLPQARRRLFITGTKHQHVTLSQVYHHPGKLSDILEQGLPTVDSDFTRKLLASYTIDQITGKAIQDKRGGKDNIHSWDFGLKGEVTGQQKYILTNLLKQRRRTIWCDQIGIPRMNGIPLTLDQISTFIDIPKPQLKMLLDDLVTKGYLQFCHARNKNTGQRDTSLEKGYNLHSGNLSFQFGKVLHPDHIAPTIVATDVAKIGVPDNQGIRQLSIREGLRLFGFPEWYELPMDKSKAFDLLGNTVALPVSKFISTLLHQTASHRV